MVNKKQNELFFDIKRNVPAQTILAALIATSAYKSAPGRPEPKVDALEVFMQYKFWFVDLTPAKIKQFRVNDDLEALAQSSGFLEPVKNSLVPTYLLDLPEALRIIERDDLLASARKHYPSAVNRILEYSKQMASSVEVWLE